MKICLIVVATGYLAVPLPLFGAPIASALALQQQGIIASGRVLDAQGQPVAGALIAPLETGIAPVQSAPDGTFTLPELPAGDFTLLAAKGKLSATQKISADGAALELRLLAPRAMDLEALTQIFIARGPGYWIEADFNSGRDMNRMEQLARLGATSPLLTARETRSFVWFVQGAAQHNPVWTRLNAARLLALFPDGDDKKAAESAIALARATSPDAGDQKAAQVWLEREKGVAGAISAATVTRYLAMARVASALQAPDASAVAEFAAQIADQLSAKTRLSNALKWGAEFALISEPNFAGAIENWDKKTQIAAYDGAVRGLSEAGDIEAARRALARLEILVNDPEIQAASALETGVRSFYETPVLELQNARGALVRALSERDPAAALLLLAATHNTAPTIAPTDKTRPAVAQSALRMSDAMDSFARQNALLWIGNGARLRGDKATATAALRQVFEFKIGNTEPFALAAWYGAQIDPALGAELFALARARVERKSPFGNRYSIGDVAYYLARLDPAQSRLLVEREWARRVPDFGQKSSDASDASAAATKLVRAMLVIDLARAVQMAKQLETAEGDAPDPGGARGRARATWLSALSTDPVAIARGDLVAR